MDPTFSVFQQLYSYQYTTIRDARPAPQKHYIRGQVLLKSSRLPCHVFYIWLLWWPPIRGGTLQMLVLWPEKLNQIDSFCKSGILYAWGGPRSIERCKKHGAPPKKIVFPRPICHFLSLSWKVAATNQDKMILAWKVAATNQAKLILAWKVAARLRFSFLQEIFSNRQWFFLVLVGIYEFQKAYKNL